jgi:hypothetical protein
MLFESTCPAGIIEEEQQITQEIVLAAWIAHDQALAGEGGGGIFPKLTARRLRMDCER